MIFCETRCTMPNRCVSELYIVLLLYSISSVIIIWMFVNMYKYLPKFSSSTQLNDRVSVLEGNNRRGLVFVGMKHITEGCTRKAFEIVSTVRIIIKMDLFVTNKLVSSLSSHLQKLASIESERTVCICKLKTYAFVLQ